MLASLFSQLLLSQIEAQKIYDEIQAQARKAHGMRFVRFLGQYEQQYEITYQFEKPNKFQGGGPNLEFYSDGEWFLMQEFGEVTHRPVLPTDTYFVIGMECFYQNRPPLKIVGLQSNPNRPNSEYALLYEVDGKTERLTINPKTKLPAHVELTFDKSKTLIKDVPRPLSQVEIARKVSSALASVKSFVLTRITSIGNQTERELIYFKDRDHIYVENLNDKNFKYLFNPETKMHHWLGSKPPQKASQVNLRGFDPLTHVEQDYRMEKTPLIGSRFGGFNYYIDSYDKSTDLSIRTFYSFYTLLPGGYVCTRDNRNHKIVRYDYFQVNPQITFEPIK